MHRDACARAGLTLAKTAHAFPERHTAPPQGPRCRNGLPIIATGPHMIQTLLRNVVFPPLEALSQVHPRRGGS